MFDGSEANLFGSGGMKSTRKGTIHKSIEFLLFKMSTISYATVYVIPLISLLVVYFYCTFP